MTKKDLQGLPVKEMMHCDGCGGYHPMEECEVVVIRMIKGKDCNLNASVVNHNAARKALNLDKVEIPEDVSFFPKDIEKEIPIKKDDWYGCVADKKMWLVKADSDETAKLCPVCGRTGISNDEAMRLKNGGVPVKKEPFVEDAPGEGHHISPAELEERNKTRKNIIPKGIASMMIPDTSPKFESEGAKEVRVV